MSFEENGVSILKNASISYTHCFCEENIWQICEWTQKNVPHLLEDSFAVLISNEKECIPIWAHTPNDPEKLICWDYHVIFIFPNKKKPEDKKEGYLVYDFDYYPKERKKGDHATIPSFKTYCFDALHTHQRFLPEYRRLYRVIPASEYLAQFTSDRKHMINSDGEWLSPPPKYECVNLQKPNLDPRFSLPSLRNMKENKQFLYDEESLIAKFS